MPIEASHDGGLLPSTVACPGAVPTLRRPCRNYKTASHIRKSWRAHRNGVSVHMRPVVSCGLADPHRRSPIRLQNPPPGSRLERNVVKPSIIVPSPGPGVSALAAPAAAEINKGIGEHIYHGRADRRTSLSQTVGETGGTLKS